MRINIDVIMTILLVVFICGFVAVIVYGEVWRIRLIMTDTRFESFDYGHAQNAFIASCVCIASGAPMLYLFATKFSPEQKEEKPPTSTPSAGAY